MKKACLVVTSIFIAQCTVLARASEESTLQELVVTGERLARPQSETASSVVVNTGESIESLSGADRIEQVLALTPNVQFGSGAVGPTIRGQDSTGVLRDLPAFLGGTRPRATLQVDGRAVSFNEFVFGLSSVWDVDRVEVFRSPQTTTQGRNSIGGAIFVETRDPGYEWEGRVRVLGGNYDTRQGSAVISGPLVADQLAFRIAGDLRRSRTSTEIGEGVIAGPKPNNEDYGVIRVKLLAEPEALPGMRLLTTYTHVDSNMPQYDAVNYPFDKRMDPQPLYGYFSTDVDSLSAVLDYPFAPALASKTTLSYGDSSITRFARPGLGQTQTHSTDFSIESVLHWDPAQPVQLLGGVNYLHSQLDQFINLSAVLGVGSFADQQQSLGLFGEMESRPTARLLLTAGIRYQRDSQDRHGLLGGSGAGFPVDFNQTFDAWLPKFSAAYELTGAIRVGALIQRAYNPGGTTLNLNTGTQINFGAETLWNYEVFTRTSFAGGRATLSANLFYNDISDAQRAQSRPYTVPGGATAFWAEIQNVPVAESHGLEVELDWLVASQLSARAGLGLLDTRIIETTNPADPIRGKEFQRSPAMTASLALDWRPTERWRLSAQGRHNSDYYSDDANTSALHIAGTTVVDLRTSYDAGRWSVFAYARNLFDRFYLTELYSRLRGAAGDPGEYGLGIEARF
jgi:iron complex outermembrane recepter protein